MFRKLFHGNRKYFTLALFSIFLFFIVGIISPIIQKSRSVNWFEISKNEKEKIEEFVYDYISDEIAKILSAKKILKEKINSACKSKTDSRKELLESLNDEFFGEYSVAAADSLNELVAWNKGFNHISFFSNIHFNFGEIFFSRSDLVIYLGVIDTVQTSGGKYFTWIGIPVEKRYRIQNEYFEEVSLQDYFSQKFRTTIKINYSEFANPGNSKSTYSFQLLNNFNNKIGVVSFESPSRETYLASLKDLSNTLQSLLIILVLIFVGIRLSQSLAKVKSKFLKWILVSVYFIGFRLVLYLTTVPVKFFKGDIVNPAYFSSTFGGGIAKSPLEFVITSILLFSICLAGYKYAIKYQKEIFTSRMSLKAKFLLLILPLGAFYFLSLRGMAATIKSVIFDSSLLYFEEPSLLPDSPVALMQLGILILGISAFMGTTILLIILFKNIPEKLKTNKSASFILIFFIFQIIGILFDVFQKEPQGTPLIRISFITFSFLIEYSVIYLKKKSAFNFLLISFAASYVMINLLSYYNTLLEKESIKTTAYELTLRSENWLEYVIFETLNGKENGDEIEELFVPGSSPNYDAAGFRIWSKSPLQKQFFTSSIGILNKDGAYLGGFDFLTNQMYIPLPRVNLDSIKSPEIFKENILYTDYKILRGITPIKLAGSTAGYLEAAVLYDINNIESLNSVSFLTSGNLFEGSAIPYDKLKIFNFIDGKIKNEIGGYTLSEDEKAKLLSVDFKKLNEAWLNLKLNNENHLFYVLKPGVDSRERILAVALKEKDISFGLFDFFKVLFIHMVYIAIALLIYLLFRLKDFRQMKITFRLRVMSAFMLVALVPLLLIAVYLRNLTNEKNTEANAYKLSKRAVNIREYVSSYLTESNLTMNAVFEKASHDLMIDFTIYKNKEIIYSSQDGFYRAGLFSPVLNPVVYNELMLSGIHEFQIEENIEKNIYNAYFMKADFNGETFIIRVDDLFNYIQMPMGGSETDIFLFVSYSLAVILIIILSTVLSNQISSPIRKLTTATKSIAGGDLSIEISGTSRGEIQDLVDGFNYMVKELNRNQVELAGFEREAAWKEMAKQVAHEIKNPLTPMKLAVQQLMAAYRDKSPRFDEIFEKVTKTVISQIEILKNIASEFSAFARMPNLNLKAVNLNDIINDSVNLFIEEKVRFDLHIETANAVVLADSDQMKRTIINLIRNSIQAGADKISVKLNSDGNKFFLRLTDNGKGIQPDVVEKIFDANFTTKQKGMGIGLTIAKKFIESINSTIAVEETSSAGTTFLITFPVHSNG